MIDFTESQIDSAVLLACNGSGDAEVRYLLRENLGLTPEQSSQLLAIARERIQAAAAWNVRDELGTAIVRLQALFAMAASQKQLSVGLQIQKEINRLLGLAAAASEAAAAGGDAVDDELQAIADHVGRAGLMLPEGYPLREQVRVLVDRLMRAESNAKRTSEVD